MLPIVNGQKYFKSQRFKKSVKMNYPDTELAYLAGKYPPKGGHA